jgi:cell division protein FtsB
MAKALFGYLGRHDPYLLADMSRLRRRARELEAEIAMMREKNDALAAAARRPRAVIRRATGPAARAP